MDQETRILLFVGPGPLALFEMGIHPAALLRKLNYHVETARSGSEALIRMEQKPPHVVVIESVLPDMSGPELLRRMKEAKKLDGIPVVFTASPGDRETEEACARLGCAACLVKPLESESFYRTLQKASEAAPRSNIRLATRLKVIVGDGTTMGGAERVEYATQISVGGVYISTRYPQPRNTATPLRIFLPEKQVKTSAVVIYGTSAGEDSDREAGMGMKFVEISDEDRAAIRNFIKNLLENG